MTTAVRNGYATSTTRSRMAGASSKYPSAASRGKRKRRAEGIGTLAVRRAIAASSSCESEVGGGTRFCASAPLTSQGGDLAGRRPRGATASRGGDLLLELRL